MRKNEKASERASQPVDEGRVTIGWGYLGLTESGVWATCFDAFTIVYRHRSTECPLPYTVIVIHSVGQEIKEEKELLSKKEEEGGERGKERK